jgi:HEAT repeat protein
VRDSRKVKRNVRWIASVVLVVMGLSVTWAWGQVARLAEPANPEPRAEAEALYAAWQGADGLQSTLFRSVDGGASWEPLALPEGAAPVVWADDGGDRLAVVLDDGLVLRSEDRGDNWVRLDENLPVLSLAWADGGNLYLGTDGQGIYRMAADSELEAITPMQGELASDAVQHLAVVDGRLFAATPTVLFYTDDDGDQWVKSLPAPGWISALAAPAPDTVFVGTETTGIFKSIDAGASWQPVSEGLGLAAGQMVKITALQVDPSEPDVLYAAVGDLLGGTEVHFSADGTFVTVDGGASWQPLAGPTWPAARQALELVVASDRPLYVQAVTASGLQSYEPDVGAALVALKSDDPQVRLTAARTLGFARSQEAAAPLLAALADPSPAVSLVAAEALGQIDDPATTSGLLVAIEHPNDQVRLGAARALGLRASEGAVGPLRAMLLNGDGAEVAVAAEALSRIGTPAATDALLTALADPVMTSRRHAALAALETMGARAVSPLADMLDSEDSGARGNAVEALAWLGSPSATPALVAALGDRNAAVREKAAWALGEIGDPAARAALERAEGRDPVAAVRTAAQAALTHIGQQPAATNRWLAVWAPALNRLQALRWLILAMSLAGAAWLTVGQRRLSLNPIHLWPGRQ